MQQRNWLQVGEYVTLGCSALGTAATAITQQAAYAATPLTLALSLNVINRQRAWKRQAETNALVQTRTSEVQKQIKALPSSNHLSDIEQLVRELNEQTQAIEQQLETAPNSQAITDLQKITTELEQQLGKLNLLKAGFNDLQTQVNALQQNTVHSLTEELQSLQNNLRQRNNELTKLQQELSGYSEKEEVAKLSQSVTETHNQIIALTKRIQSYPKPEILAELIPRFSQLKQKIENYPDAGQIGRIEAELSLLNQQFNELSESNNVRVLITKLTTIQSQVTKLNANYSALGRKYNELIVPKIKHLLSEEKITQNSLEEFRQKLVEAENPSLQQQLDEYQQQLTSLTEQLNQYAETEDLESVKNELEQQFSNTHQRISSLENNLNSQIAKLKVNISQTNTRLAKIQEKTTQIVNPIDVSTVKDLELIQQRLQEKEDQLEKLQSQLQNLTDEFVCRSDVTSLEQQLTNLQVRFQIVSKLATQVGQVKRELRQKSTSSNEVQEQLSDLELRTSNLQNYTGKLAEEKQKQIDDIYERVEDFSTLSATIQGLQSDMKTLESSVQDSVKTTDLDNATSKLLETLSHQIDQVNETQLTNLKELLQQTKPAYQYELVYDRSGSRQILLESIKNAQKRLILVCPWLTGYGADSKVMKLLKNALSQGVRIDIGWGHLKDIKNDKLGEGFLYSELDSFQKLSRQYPNQFRMKLLGTHEKYLVCDDVHAMLGSHNFLTSNTYIPEREIGILTNDPQLIGGLIQRFDNAQEINLSYYGYQYL